MSPEDRKITGVALQSALVELIGLGLQAKQAHWNLTGPLFRSVHLHLDEVVDTARKHADIIAERAAAIGMNPDGRAETISRDAMSAPFGSGSVPDSDAITKMTQLLGGVVNRLREGIRETADADPVTQDLLIAAAHKLDKHHWMFQAQMQ